MNYTRFKDNYVIVIDGKTYKKTFTKEEFDSFLLLNKENQLKVLSTKIDNVYEKNGQFFIEGIDLPIKNLLGKHIYEAFKQNDKSKFESLKNFHLKCSKSKIDLDYFYDHLEKNNFKITEDGDVLVFKKAMIETKKDFSKYFGFYLDKNEVKCKHKVPTQEEIEGFINLINDDTIYASHSYNYNISEEFSLIDDKGNETKMFDKVQYKIGYITKRKDDDKESYQNVNCGKKLHSTTQENYALTFSGNIILTCLLNPEWVVNVPPSDSDWKLGSYALKTIGINYDKDLQL